MKVKELIAELEKLDQNLEVYGWCEDEALLAEGHLFRVLAIEDLEVGQGELMRLQGEPSFKIGRGEYSHKILFINVTSEF